MKVTHGQLVVARVGRFVWPLLVAGMIVALIIGWPPSTSNSITSGLIGISAILGIINSTIVVRRFRRENDEGSRPSSPQ
jgi:phosphate/sulfate permease